MNNFNNVFSNQNMVVVNKNHKDLLIYELLINAINISLYREKIVVAGDTGIFLYENYPRILHSISFKVISQKFNADGIKSIIKALNCDKLFYTIKIGSCTFINSNKLKFDLNIIDNQNTILTGTSIIFEKYFEKKDSILYKNLYLKFLDVKANVLIEQKEMLIVDTIRNILDNNIFSPLYIELERLHYLLTTTYNSGELQSNLKDYIKNYEHCSTINEVIFSLEKLFNNDFYYEQIMTYISKNKFKEYTDYIISKLKNANKLL
ncbi:MAG: hypothetical protein RR909_01645 [Bacilli bacterium]